MDHSHLGYLVVKLVDNRTFGGDWQLVEVPIPLSSHISVRGDIELIVSVNALVSSLQCGPAAIIGPANIFYVCQDRRECILKQFNSMDREMTASGGTIPVSDNLTIQLEIEHPYAGSEASPIGDPLHQAAVETSYSILKRIPDDCLPGMPRWTAESLADHDMELASLSEEQLIQLEAYRFQECRGLRRTEFPVTYEMEYGTGQYLPHRPHRPWETSGASKGMPAWLRHRKPKADQSVETWSPSVKPVYATFVFTPGEWDFPDNSNFTRAEINSAIVRYLKSHLVEKPGYWEFVESKGRSLPLLDLLRQCFFAKCMLHELTKIRCPPILPVCGGSVVTKENVLAALGRRPSWGSDCVETLELVDLYGPAGPREHETVTNAIYADAEHQMGSVQFLKLLRTVDKEWHNRH